MARLYAVFISNHHASVIFFQHKVGNRQNDYLAMWDYHVLAVYDHPDQGPMVYDLDCLLPFPTPLKDYIGKVFKDSFFAHDAKKRIIYKPRFRVIPATTYLKAFSSDRSRMILSNGNYSYPPPPYPCIQGDPNVTNNINSFIDTSPKSSFPIGTVMSLEELATYFENGCQVKSE